MKDKCFALGKDDSCIILTVENCEGHSCGFYKTEVQLRQSQQAAYDFIAQKSFNDQRWIAEKYYGGKMPWLKLGDHHDKQF